MLSVPVFAQSDTATKATDPVCGMKVDTKTAEKAAHEGKTYYFCSRSDKEKFEKAPAQYLNQSKKK